MNRYLIRNSIRFYSSFFGFEILKYFRTFLSGMWCSLKIKKEVFMKKVNVNFRIIKALHIWQVTETLTLKKEKEK